MQARPSCHENHAGGSSWHRFLQDQNKDCGLHRGNDRHDRGSAPGCSACLCMIHTSFVTASCSCESLSTPQLGSSRFSRQIRQRPSTNPIKMSCRFARVDAPPPQTRPSRGACVHACRSVPPPVFSGAAHTWAALRPLHMQPLRRSKARPSSRTTGSRISSLRSTQLALFV
jgi:hypothetical protein